MSKFKGLELDSEARPPSSHIGCDPDRKQSRICKGHDRSERFLKGAQPDVSQKRSTFFTNPLFVPNAGNISPALAMSSAHGGAIKGGPLRKLPARSRLADVRCCSRGNRWVQIST
jgi:hypothetical protein